MKPSNLNLVEYKAIYRSDVKEPKKEENGNIALPPKLFEALENFYFANADAQHFFQPAKVHGKKALRAKNYVGLVQFHDGTTIEILPKIADLENDIEGAREILLRMLRTLKKSPFRHLDKARLKATRLPLFEIFVSMFLEAVADLVRRGIKSDYISREENLKYLKGKLKIGEHLKRNFIHKERFYVAYDEFLSDRVENRLIKTTLQTLYKRSRSSVNQQRIREFLFVFDDIGTSHDHRSDFKKVKLDRQMAHYEQVLAWCRIFLLGQSFGPYRGRDVAFALLFDMNRLFESYVGAWFKVAKEYTDRKIVLQHGIHHLVYLEKKGREKDGKFRLKPDIVIDGGDIVADTKWKLLDEENKNQGVSQGDMYQLFAYGKKYEGCKELLLIYPKSHTKVEEMRYFFQDDLPLSVRFFDVKENRLCDGDEIL
ncbi:McrC family protein [Hydrogenimonas cancrithermarum]|uniref:McrBC 5-methylcytosine restriction system component n=1 Tax=Hydrogenimonas cancrithermarum TaxID=2993563 RepID=A0ABM8FNE4_9BACT|nr:McrC family protein [Hydrogenimonas cancrithermarum]BDY13885.1 mcrBC 5-methylcytosine restriction system component [Hydrogenimonas cancrithermarum]